METRPLFIAEASSNHGRDLDRARAFVDAAADAGCDAVKFQLFKIDRMFAPEILSRSEKHRARAAWELPLEHLAPLAEHCSARNIQFSCTPFYLEAVAELAPFVDFYKVASYELLVTDLLAACARTGKPVILSTGMATMDEIAAVIAATDLDGLIVSNTTIGRDAVAGLENSTEIGGLSGKPLFLLATRHLAQMRQRVGGLPIIGVGGIHSPQSALAKFEAGANAIQLYSALVFGGLDLLDAIKRGLATAVRQSGAGNVGELTGRRVDAWARGEA